MKKWFLLLFLLAAPLAVPAADALAVTPFDLPVIRLLKGGESGIRSVAAAGSSTA